MDNHEDEYGKPLFMPVKSETIVLCPNTSYETEEELGLFSHTVIIGVSYGNKGIAINEFKEEYFSWLKD